MSWVSWVYAPQWTKDLLWCDWAKQSHVWTTRASELHLTIRFSRLWFLVLTPPSHPLFLNGMAQSEATIRTRKFITNPLLGRKQMVRILQ
jgi:hypothetical protein